MFSFESKIFPCFLYFSKICIIGTSSWTLHYYVLPCMSLDQRKKRSAKEEHTISIGRDHCLDFKSIKLSLNMSYFVMDVYLEL